VLLTVVIGEFLALVTHLLLHERVHDELFADGVARNLPPQLVGELGGGIVVARRVRLLIGRVVLVHLSVVR
jgi:hypothetical protein